MNRAPGAADRLARAGALAAAGATLAVGGWLYAMPAAVQSPFGLDPAGLAQFRALWHLPPPGWSPAAFRIGFWLLLAAAWTGYAALLAGQLRGGRLPRRLAVTLAVTAALAMALGCAPALSKDVYGYVGFGALAARHHLNPMVTPQSALVNLRDPVGPFLGGDVASPYGPLWSALSVALVRSTGPLGLAGQVLAFKLLVAAALLLAAWAARRAAQAIEPGRGDLAFTAVGLNPLLLLEGPGSGHNDVALVALALAAFAALAAGRPRWAALAAGAGAAIKLVPLLLIPWLALAHPGRGPRRVRLALETALLALLPLVLAYLPFWDGTRTFAGLVAWWREGHRGAAASPWPFLLMAACYAGASAFVLRSPELPRLATAWAAASVAALFWGAGTWFPWYLAWPMAGLALRGDRRHVAAGGLLMLLGALLTAVYAG